MILNKLKTYTTLVIFLMLLFSIDGYSQNTKDTVIAVTDYSKYIELPCLLREDLIKSLKNGDTVSVKKLRKATVILSSSDGQMIISRLLSVRENQMLQFYIGEYDKLLSDLKIGKDYFVSSYIVEDGYDYPNFRCSNITLSVLDFWKSYSDSIISKIEQSGLSAPEQEMLVLYWEEILLYIESEETLSPEINKMAAEYLDKYPDTQYKSFLERMSSIKKIYHPEGGTVGFGIGKSFPSGAMDQYLEGDFTFYLGIGYTFKNWNISLGYKGQLFNYKDSLRFDHIDTLTLIQSSSIAYYGFTLKLGYTLFNKGGFFKLQPFISADLNSLISYADNSNPDITNQFGQYHPVLGFGVEGAIRITKNLFNENAGSYMYYPREEKDIYSRPLYLNFRLGYYPNVFDKPTNIDGSLLYFTVGFEWMIGINRVSYRIKHKG